MSEQKMLLKEFSFEDPEDPAWPYKIVVLAVYDEYHRDNLLKWVFNPDEPSAGFVMYEEEIDRYLQVLTWIKENGEKEITPQQESKNAPE